MDNFEAFLFEELFLEKNRLEGYIMPLSHTNKVPFTIKIKKTCISVIFV
jgi:hypothetical protein